MCVLAKNGGQIKLVKLRGPWSDIADQLKELGGPVAVVYEASFGYGRICSSNASSKTARRSPWSPRLILLQQHGYFVLRFLAEDVGKQLDGVLDAILRALSHSQSDRRNNRES